MRNKWSQQIRANELITQNEGCLDCLFCLNARWGLVCLTRWRLEDDNLEVQSERLTLLDLPDIDSYNYVYEVL